MDESFFIEYVADWFPGVAENTVEKLNDTTNPNAISYLHRSMLQKEYSVDLKWNSNSITGSIVAADVVAMDSPLPLKRRDKIGSANGDIPKQGLEFALREKELTDLDILSANPRLENELIRKLFRDTERAIQGHYERLEYMFLEGLSTGITLVEDSENVGTGIRCDYGYLNENKFGVAALWAGTTGTPFTDLNRLKAKAVNDGNNVTLFMLDQATFNHIAKTQEAKDLYASSINFFGAGVPTPTLQQINAAAQANFGYTFQIVERVVRFEKDGIQTSKKPWAVGQVIGLTSTQVGTLTYGTLAEMNHPVQNVTYTVADDFILVSKFRTNRPSLAEFTSAAALVLPVIKNVDRIYSLDTLTVQA